MNSTHTLVNPSDPVLKADHPKVISKKMMVVSITLSIKKLMAVSMTVSITPQNLSFI